MPSFIGVPELLILLVVVLLIFGPKKLPQLGRSLGSGMREFKDSVTGKNKDDDEPDVIEGPDRSNVTTTAAADAEETETERRARDAKTVDAS
jgi:sec-independent protein translocase protein TatA